MCARKVAQVSMRFVIELWNPGLDVEAMLHVPHAINCDMERQTAPGALSAKEGSNV